MRLRSTTPIPQHNVSHRLAAASLPAGNNTPSGDDAAPGQRVRVGLALLVAALVSGPGCTIITDVDRSQITESAPGDDDMQSDDESKDAATKADAKAKPPAMPTRDAAPPDASSARDAASPAHDAATPGDAATSGDAAASDAAPDATSDATVKG